MKYKYILILVFSFCLLGNSTAQVTIGEEKIPAPFSVLQLEGNSGGLRLPQLTETKRDSIQKHLFPTDKTHASGLMIYNTITKRVEYWDGAKWTNSLDVYAQNGLSSDNLGLKLGGILLRNTDISIKNYDLKYIIRESESFNLYNTIFDITGKNVSLNTPSFSIQNTTSNSLLYIGNETAKNNSVVVNSNGLGTFSAESLNSTAKIEVVSNSAGSTTTISNKMVYKDNGTNTEMGKALIAEDSQGTARWADLRPVPKVVTGELKVGSESPDIYTKEDKPNNAVTKNITKTPLVLSPGKWLIFANIHVKAAEAAPRHDSGWGGGCRKLI